MFRVISNLEGNHLINRFISNQLESIYTDHTSSSKNWYQTTTVVGHNLTTFLVIHTNFHRPSSLALYLHCQQVYNPVHYLFNCPTHLMYRRRLKVHLLPEDYKLPDHLAALIIRKSTFLPDIITPTSPGRLLLTPSSTIKTEQKSRPGGSAQ